MARHTDTKINLSELEELLAKCPAAMRQLFVKAINIYADPMKNAEDDDRKRGALQAVIEKTTP